MDERGRILIVEDMPDWADTLRDILKREGYDVETAAGYREALEALKRAQMQPYSLIIVDLRLSPIDEENRDGMNILGNAFDQGVPTIVVTGYSTEELTHKAFREYGTFDFFDKHQFNTDKFRESVRQAVLDRKASREPTPEQKQKFEQLVKRLFSGETISAV